MKITFKNILNQILAEGHVRSTLPLDERIKKVADKVMEYMDNFNTTYIPDYRFLQDWKPKENDTFRQDMKYLLQKYIRRGEYDIVKSFIKNKRPESTFTVSGGKRHKVDEYVTVISSGEKIVYNTFKMNGIILSYEDPRVFIYYEVNGEWKLKKPDFYWEQQDAVIEIAGLDDFSFGKNYREELEAAKIALETLGKKVYVLDYFSYRKDLQGFYKYVCETFKEFGFKYDPMDFWTANISEGIDKEELKREVDALIKKGGAKSSAEIEKLRKIVTQTLTKPNTDNSKPEGYEGVWDYRRDTGVGMRWSDPELRNKVKDAWCKSTGSNLETIRKFKELFPDIPLSKTTIEKIKSKFTDEFDKSKKDELCDKKLDENLSRIKSIIYLTYTE
jgi:hypothetical protein